MQRFERITIIGLGLIGSSIARAVHERGICDDIVGCDPNEISLAYARKHGFITTAMADAKLAVGGSSLIILAAPPDVMGDIAEAIAPALKPGMAVMDCCSVKQPAIEAIAPHIPPGVDFIPAHPIAGSEQTGVSAGRADLFERKRVIITPTEPRQELLSTANQFWQALGARVEAMPPHIHDLVYAYVSHLPQLLAFAAATPLGDDVEDESLSKFTRLNGSNPALWTEIFMLNHDNLIKALDRYLDALIHIQNELKQAPADTPSGDDVRLARTRLFPRIAASCLITTVMEAEKRAGFPFARFAGTGFADFTSPVATPPEEEIEQIAGQYGALAPVLAMYVDKLKAIRDALMPGESPLLQETLSNS